MQSLQKGFFSGCCSLGEVVEEEPFSEGLRSISRTLDWESDPSKVAGAAKGIYLRLPGAAKLWLKGREFETLDPIEVKRAMI